MTSQPTRVCPTRQPTTPASDLAPLSEVDLPALAWAISRETQPRKGFLGFSTWLVLCSCQLLWDFLSQCFSRGPDDAAEAKDLMSSLMSEALHEMGLAHTAGAFSQSKALKAFAGISLLWASCRGVPRHLPYHHASCFFWRHYSAILSC